MTEFGFSAITAKLYNEAIVDASNQEYREQLTEAVLLNQIGPVWNMAAEALLEHGRPTLVEDGPWYKNKRLRRLSTGLLELSGMTGDLTEEVPAVRISATFDVKPEPVTDVQEFRPTDTWQEMTFEAYTLRPQRPDDDKGAFRVRETQWLKAMRRLPENLLHNILYVAVANNVRATGHAVLHPETGEPLVVRLRRPHLNDDRWYSRNNEELDEELAFAMTRTYKDMSVLFGLIGAIGGPLRNKPGFVQK